MTEQPAEPLAQLSQIPQVELDHLPIGVGTDANGRRALMIGPVMLIVPLDRDTGLKVAQFLAGGVEIAHTVPAGPAMAVPRSRNRR